MKAVADADETIIHDRTNTHVHHKQNPTSTFKPKPNSKSKSKQTKASHKHLASSLKQCYEHLEVSRTTHAVLKKAVTSYDIGNSLNTPHISSYSRPCKTTATLHPSPFLPSTPIQRFSNTILPLRHLRQQRHGRKSVV